ncbi:cytochrome P450 [Aspergillus saccharolyticus JOP 1030-1]|uniref:Cytochrome P450 monooxygenase n=1 Tax=Aspergillus saccharolyticus JOP 1030-1 TaxID=1450539 RepID=A0A318ZJX5_9EURO|nr:cytochrome P450 monooxygenase [Aspergillus saccharolyticus JOP 1030-1]PYH47157.1 cytochrome P450 monooxygenase [Aspergillus saccharolyticus JOP 1030-1]
MSWAVDYSLALLRTATLQGILTTVIAVTISYAILSVVYLLNFHPLAKYPGPRLAAVTRLVHSYHLLSGTVVRFAYQAHEKYGSVVRIAPDEILFTSSKAWEAIYGLQPGRLEMSKDTPLFRGPRTPHAIVTAEHNLHRLYRRLLSKGFSESALREQEPSKIDLLMTQLHKAEFKGVAPEMTSWYNSFTFDLIGELAFGESFGCLESSTYQPWVAMIFEAMKYRGFMQALSYYPSVSGLLLALLPKSYAQTFATHKQLTHEKVQRRIERKVTYNDLTANLLNPDHKLERYQIDGNCSTLIIAGSETTSVALSATTYYLTQNPEAKAKVIQEVRSTFSKPGEITSITVHKLEYLPACFTEAMRRFPPGPAVFPRRVPKEGAWVAGHWIPGGMQVGICHFAANNSHLNFKDPQKFIPERWLGDPAYAKDDRHAMQVFSVGPRNCLGQSLAKLELHLVLCRFIWEFDWELSPESEKWDLDTPVFNTWGVKPLRIFLTPACH